MHLYTRSTITDPSALMPEERRIFGHALFEVHRQIFEGVDFESFYHYVVDSPALRTRIETYYARSGELVGYCAMHTFERQLEGRSARIHRVETGLLPAYRGRARCANILAREFSWALLSAIRKEHYFFGCLVHPSAYCGLSRHVEMIWPHHERPTPPELLAFMGALADDFGLKTVTDRDPLIRKVGWVTRQDRDEHQRWHQSRDPRVKLYLRANPDYRAGLGMSTLIPVTAGAVVIGFSRNLLYKLRRQLKRSWGRLSAGSGQRKANRIKRARSQAPQHQGGSAPCPSAAL